MSQITIGGTTLNFKDSAFTGDQWEQVASWVLNGGAEGIDANAQIATEKAAAASASAAAARNSATSAGESAAAADNSEKKATEAATKAEAASNHPPRINSNGKWELWDATQGAYVATEYTAIGKDGTRWWTYAYLVANMSGELLIGKRSLPAAVVGDYVLGTKNDSGVVYTITGETSDGSWWVVKRECIIKGAAGADGITPHIGDNGNWYIGDTDTGVSAGGSDLPTVTDADAGKYLHVNASTKKLEWAEIGSASNYVLTEADKEEIAAMVLSKMSGGGTGS